MNVKNAWRESRWVFEAFIVPQYQEIACNDPFLHLSHAFLVGLVVGLLAFLSLFTLFLTIPLLIAFVVPLALWAPIYLFEDITVMESFKKTFRLGFATWGGVFLISLIMGFIANVLQGVTMMPWYIATLVKYFFSLSDVGS